MWFRRSIRLTDLGLWRFITPEACEAVSAHGIDTRPAGVGRPKTERWNEHVSHVDSCPHDIRVVWCFLGGGGAFFAKGN